MPLKGCYDIHAKGHLFVPGDTVYVQNFDRGSPNIWLPGNITQAMGPLSFQIALSDGRIVHRHTDHIRKRCAELTMDSWMQHPNHLNLFHHKLCPPRLTLLNQNSLNKNKIFQQLSLLLSSLVPRLSPPNGKQSLVALGG